MKTPLSFLISMPLLFPLIPTGTGAAPALPTSAPSTATSTLVLPLASAERTDLAVAEQASRHELMDLRGGDLTNYDLWTVLLVLGIVVLVLILL